MKYKCVKKCQVRLPDGVHLVGKGKVFSEDQVKGIANHPCFISLDQEALNFETASREELEARPWKFSDAYKAIEELYGVQLKKEEGTLKSDIITQIFDARFREVD